MKIHISNRPWWASQPASSGLWASGAALTAAFLLLATANLRAGAQNGVLVGSVCGGGPYPYYGYVEGNPANSTDAQFHTPMGLALDSTGEYLFVADCNNNKLRVVDLSSSSTHFNLTYTFAPIPGFTSGTITNPVGVALDADDNVYVLNRGNGKNGIVVVFDYYFGDLLGTSAMALTNANGITLDSAGNIYVTASNNLFRITFSSDFTTSSTTLVTNVTTAGANLQGLVVMDSRMIAACDSGTNGNGIYLINPTNGAISILTGFHGAGDNTNIWDSTPNHPVSKAAAMFNQPMGLAKAGSGMLVVADYLNNRVKVVNSAGTVTNLYGVSSNLWLNLQGLWPGYRDGYVTVPDAQGDVEARLPNGVLLAANSAGGATVYVTEDYYHLIRKVTGTSLPAPLPWPPAPPTGLAAAVNCGQVTLTWTASSGATNYNIYRAATNGGPYATITNTASTSYTDTSVLNGTSYYYVVSAVGAGGEGPYSAQATATPVPPPAPTIMTAVANYGLVALTWSTVACPGVTYIVKRSTSSGGPYTILANTGSTSYSDTNVLNGTTYDYVVSAVTTGGEGPNSAQVSATPPLPPVRDPQIGYVDFPATSTPIAYTSVFHPVSSYVANNDAPIVIQGTPGSQTFYTFGPTGGSIPDPTSASASAPVGYQDGLTPGQVATYAIAQVLPDLTIKAIGEKPDGSPNSAIVQVRVQFITANPMISGNNAAKFTVSDITANAQLWYTVDGSTPTNAPPSVGPIPSGATLSLPFPANGSNFTFKTIAVHTNYQSSAIVSTIFSRADFVPDMSISPNSGYYPMGQTIAVSSFNPNVYYTADGSDPTTNSQPVSMTNNVGYIKWFNSTNDLRGLRVKAFSLGGASDTISGQPATLNTIGVPPDPYQPICGGIGAQIVVPVVANLQPNATIQSYQFRVEVSPNGSAQPISSGFDALSFSTNDLIPLASYARAGTVGFITYQPYTLGTTNGLEIYAVGNTNNVSFQNFAVVALLRIAIPPGAVEGDSYTLAVSYPSATSDGVSAAVPLTPMAPATILVTNIAYKVGDSASSFGGWYNAGTFGNGDLDNSDVNLAFHASLGRQVPYAFTDVYNAMDAYPVDGPGFVGGDGQIRFLDWNVILQRSLRMDTNNWARAWSMGGDLVDASTTLVASKAMSQVAQAQVAPTWPWYRQALVGAVSTGYAVAGQAVNVPVYVKLSDGVALSGVQFRAVITPQGGAPSLTQAPQFAPASGVPGPTLQQSFTASDAGFGWALGSFNYLSRSSNFVGWVTFTIPATARSGQTYSVSFANADGAPNLSVQYDFETRSACVAVGGSAPPASICSDEWKIHFFGSLANPIADDLADPDSDGVPNWMEYLAGTDPTDSNSRLQLSGAASQAGKAQSQMVIHWLTAPGKTYEAQWSSSLSGGSWSTLATVSGDGTVASCSDTNSTPTVRYYRLHVLP
jgi:hypothetical protein